MSREWLVELSSGSTAVVYVFPPGGGGAAAVTDLLPWLPGVRVVAVRLPGRESLAHMPCVTDVNVIAADLAAAIKSDASALPVLLYGHCGGAVIAYEVATLLENHASGIVVSGYGPPDQIIPTGAWTLPDDEFLSHVARDGYMPEEVLGDPELLDLCLPALRGDYEAIETHQASDELLAIPVTVLLGENDTKVGQHDIAGWSRFAPFGFDLRSLPSAAHNLLNEDPESVGRELKRVLSGLDD